MTCLNKQFSVTFVSKLLDSLKTYINEENSQEKCTYSFFATDFCHVKHVNQWTHHHTQKYSVHKACTIM